MTNIMETDTELCRNSIRYLHEVSLLYELNVPALKSIYSTKRRLMELRNSILLPSYFTRTSVTCQRCLINLKDGPANYRVLPAKKQTTFARKVLAKQKNGKPLSKYQQKYFKKINQFCGNHLAIMCKFCKNEALIKMEKPKKEVKQKAISLIKSKKKKKKDKFCGLKEDAVLSLSYQNKSEKKENLMKSKNTLKKKQNLNKLSEILNKSNSIKKPISSLKQFLQAL